jgi:hypothetical protein
MVRTGRLAALTALAFALLVASAHAIPTDPDDTENLPPCLHKFSVPSFGLSPSRVDLGESTTLAWRIVVPVECRNQLSFTLNGKFIGLQESRRFTPQASTNYTLQVRGPGQLPRTIDTATLTVDLPDEVTIDRSDQEPLFAQAVGTAGTTVRVASGVQLDLSAYENIAVAGGVDVLGGRSPRSSGPLLYTTTRPKRLLVVSGDDVRIAGLRIHGPDMGVADEDGGPATGIYIVSRNNVEIDHNEIAGWKNAGVGVNDDNDRISYVLNPETVRIHDNFIHHNQRTGGWGYGVVIGDGAYALIDRNVFDYNRHAIATDGSDDSGYRAYENLVLENGGKHRKVLWKWYYTHQFDVHGQENCGVWSIFSDSLWNCGTAGHDVEVRRNSFLYTKDNAFKLRGTPQLKPYGAFVYDNVFAHSKLGDAVHQNESGMITQGNRLGIDGSDRLGSCDFDNDGLADKFMATGQTWWYASRTGQWNYYGTSKLLLSQVRLADVNGDGRCDVNPAS